jgi:ribosomal protein S8
MLHRNQIIFNELQKWYCKTPAKLIISINGLLAQLAQGWAKKDQVVFYYHRACFVPIIRILQDKGYIEAFCLVPSALVAPRKESRPLLVLFLPTQEKIYSTNKHIYFHLTKKQKIAITYSQLLYLTKNFNHTFLIHTVDGLLIHTEALKKKIGGFIVCSVV